MSLPPRYVVVEVLGYSTRNKLAATSFSVLDTAYCWREVYTAYAGEGTAAANSRRRDAYRECERLNRIDARVAA